MRNAGHHAQVTGRNFIPGVIEPSFGIGRIMYCMFEHAYYTREVRWPWRLHAGGPGLEAWIRNTA